MTKPPPRSVAFHPSGRPSMARSTRSGCGAEALRSSLTSLPGSTSRAGYGVVRRTDGSACWACGARGEHHAQQQHGRSRR